MDRKAIKEKLHKMGFTMAELLMVVAIIAILAGVGFIAAMTMIRNARQAAADKIAESIYTAAQNQLTDMYAFRNSQIEQLTIKNGDDVSNNAIDLPDVASGYNGKLRYAYISLGTSATPFDLVLPKGSISDELRGRTIVVEYLPSSARVFSVYFCEKLEENVIYKSRIAGDLRIIENRKAFQRNGEGNSNHAYVGYYQSSVQDLPEKPKDELTVKVGNLQSDDGHYGLYNYDELIADVQISGLKEYAGSSLTVELTVMGEQSGGKAMVSIEIPVEDADFAIAKSKGVLRIPVVLDSWNANKGFEKLFGEAGEKAIEIGSPANYSDTDSETYGENNGVFSSVKWNVSQAFTQGENITVTVTVNGDSNISDTATDNSLFAYGSGIVQTSNAGADERENGVYTAYLAYGRHLQNLENTRFKFSEDNAETLSAFPVETDGEITLQKANYSGKNPYIVARQVKDILFDTEGKDGENPNSETGRLWKDVYTAGTGENKATRTFVPVSNTYVKELYGDYCLAQVTDEETNQSSMVAYRNGDGNIPASVGDAQWKICELKVDANTAEYKAVDPDNAGVFATFSGDTISNIHLENPLINGKTESGSATGGLAGILLPTSSTNVTISGCELYMTDESEKATEENTTKKGWLTQWKEKNSTDPTVRKATDWLTGGTYAGGLIGATESTVGMLNISNSFAATVVRANATSGDTYAGGLVGSASGASTVTISNSYADCYIEASVNGNIGGLLGTVADNAATITHSFSAGYVVAPVANVTKAGYFAPTDSIFVTDKANPKTGSYSLFQFTEAIAVAEGAEPASVSANAAATAENPNPTQYRFTNDLSTPEAVAGTAGNAYNLDGNTRGDYTYPLVGADTQNPLPHYGDWKEPPQIYAIQFHDQMKATATDEEEAAEEGGNAEENGEGDSSATEPQIFGYMYFNKATGTYYWGRVKKADGIEQPTGSFEDSGWYYLPMPESTSTDFTINYADGQRKAQLPEEETFEPFNRLAATPPKERFYGYDLIWASETKTEGDESVVTVESEPFVKKGSTAEIEGENVVQFPIITPKSGTAAGNAIGKNMQRDPEPSKCAQELDVTAVLEAEVIYSNVKYIEIDFTAKCETDKKDVATVGKLYYGYDFDNQTGAYYTSTVETVEDPVIRQQFTTEVLNLNSAYRLTSDGTKYNDGTTNLIPQYDSDNGIYGYWINQADGTALDTALKENAITQGGFHGYYISALNTEKTVDGTTTTKSYNVIPVNRRNTRIVRNAYNVVWADNYDKAEANDKGERTTVSVTSNFSNVMKEIAKNDDLMSNDKVIVTVRADWYPTIQLQAGYYDKGHVGTVTADTSDPTANTSLQSSIPAHVYYLKNSGNTWNVYADPYLRTQYTDLLLPEKGAMTAGYELGEPCKYPDSNNEEQSIDIVAHDYIRTSDWDEETDRTDTNATLIYGGSLRGYFVSAASGTYANHDSVVSTTSTSNFAVVSYRPTAYNNAGGWGFNTNRYEFRTLMGRKQQSNGAYEDAAIVGSAYYNYKVDFVAVSNGEKGTKKVGQAYYVPGSQYGYYYLPEQKSEYNMDRNPGKAMLTQLKDAARVNNGRFYGFYVTDNGTSHTFVDTRGKFTYYARRIYRSYTADTLDENAGGAVARDTAVVHLMVPVENMTDAEIADKPYSEVKDNVRTVINEDLYKEWAVLFSPGKNQDYTLDTTAQTGKRSFEKGVYPVANNGRNDDPEWDFLKGKSAFSHYMAIDGSGNQKRVTSNTFNGSSSLEYSTTMQSQADYLESIKVGSGSDAYAAEAYWYAIYYDLNNLEQPDNLRQEDGVEDNEIY